MTSDQLYDNDKSTILRIELFNNKGDKEGLKLKGFAIIKAEKWLNKGA